MTSLQLKKNAPTGFKRAGAAVKAKNFQGGAKDDYLHLGNTYVHHHVILPTRNDALQSFFSVEIADVYVQSQSKNKHLMILQIFVCD